MVVGVIADLVPVSDDPLQQPRMLQRIFPDDEEGRRSAGPFQHLQYLRRPFRIRPIVEGQGQHLAILPAGALHLIGGGQRAIAFLFNRPERPEGDGAMALRRRGGDAQDLARPLDIGVERARHGAEPGPAAGAPGGQIRPDAGVLAAQPPQRDALDAQALQHQQLVPARGGIQHPDLMPLPRLVIGEARIAARRVVERARGAVMRGEPGFIERQRVGGPAMPVIGIAAERDDDMVRADGAQRDLRLPREPVLGGDGTGLAALPMLVVIHQDHPVRHGGEAGQRPALFPGGNGERDLRAVRQGGAQYAEEAQIAGHGAVRQGFQVHDQPRLMAAGDIAAQLPGKRQRRCGIAQQPRRARSVPAFAADILHHGQHPGWTGHGGDHAVERRVRRDMDRLAGTGHGDQGRHHPVELSDMAAQGGDAAFIARHIETDVQRTGLHAMLAPMRQPFGDVAPQRGDARQAGRMRLGQGQGEVAFRRHGDQCGGEGDGGEQDQQQRARQQAPRPKSPAAGGIEEYGSGHRSRCRPVSGQPLRARPCRADGPCMNYWS